MTREKLESHMKGQLDRLATRYIDSEDQTVKYGIEAEFRICAGAHRHVLRHMYTRKAPTTIVRDIETYIKNRESEGWK